jgi:preprotein translocase subunit SecA
VKYESGAYTLTQRGTGKVTTVRPPAPKAEEFDPLVEVFGLAPSRKSVGGLHVIGTERHTARRIDNQLRGRSGRQGDPGSSRFYVSLQDELMKLFAGEWTIKVLGFLGMKEGEAIEDKRISKGILRAQKKVEERNFLARKNLLEYDEVMDRQRGIFYGMRQKVLEGRNIDQVIWKMIGESIEDAVAKYVTSDYVATVVSEWARTNFEVTIDPDDLRGFRRIEDLEDFIKGQAKNEADSNISATLGEFMGEDRDDKTGWDIKGLSSWAMSRFQVQLSQAQIRQMDAREVEEILRDKAVEQIDARDCGGLLKYLEKDYALHQLSGWAEEKFGIRVDATEFLADPQRGIARPAGEVKQIIEKRARDEYALREIHYPVDHVLMFCFGENGSTDNPYAAEYVRQWAQAKYGTDLPPEHIRATAMPQLRAELAAMQEAWLEDGRLEEEVDRLIRENPDADSLAKAAGKRFMMPMTADDLAPRPEGARGGGDRDADGSGSVTTRDVLINRGRGFLRRELTDLEQFVLIQIFDQSWKDHLYAMDMLKQGIGLHAFAEKDPRVLYKKEGFRYFEEMMAGVRDKVTDLIFRARIMGQAPQPQSKYKVTAATHETTSSYGVAENLAGGGSATAQAAEQPQGEAAKPKTIVREAPKVGRNDPCPCGSGKKYKKCCGVNVGV